MGPLKLNVSQIRNIVFDLDDTLVGSSRAYDRAMDSLGIPKKGEKFQLARKRTKEQLPQLAPAARNRFLYFKNYLEHESSLNPAELMKLANSYDQLVAEDLWKQWSELNRLELMQSLKALGFKLYVLTNESLRLQTLKLSGFSPEQNWLSGYLTSEEVGFEKPSEKIYLKFFERFGLKASECVMIGDSFEKDIAASQKWGMQSVLTEEFLTSETKFPLTIKNLNDLSKLLA
jgi:putative hydrolase of the HAD superfamily